jgi:solute:Na+ symporter, SSS family
MNMAPADLAVISLYFCFLLIFAYLTRRNRTFNEFAVAKHAIPATLVFASLATTIVGPGFSIGFTSKAWGTGYLYYYLVLPYALQVVLVGIFIAPKFTRFRDCRSLGDVMFKKYDTLAQLLTGIISVGLCTGFSAVMGKIGGSTLSEITGWPVATSITLMTGTTALVTFSGGLRATVATEALQFALKTAVLPLLVFFAVVHAPQSLTSIDHRAHELAQTGFNQLNFWQLLGISLSFMLGEALIPPYANRALAAKDTSASRTGFVLAGLFCIVWLAMVSFLGVAAHSYLPASTPGDNVFVDIGRTLLPEGVFGLLLATVIALVMSSQESVLNSAAVAFTSDIISPFAKISEKTALWAAKAATLLCAAVSIYSAQFAPSIIDGLLLLYSIWAPTILIPLILGLYLRRTRPLAGCLSIVAGGATSILWQYAPSNLKDIPPILVGLLAASVAYALGHICGSPRHDREVAS